MADAERPGVPLPTASDPEFVKLWAGQTISQLGTWITRLALPLTAILVTNATPAELGILAALTWLPYFLFSIAVGVWLDRVSRRRVLIAADCGRCVALLWIPTAHLLGILSVWQLYVIAFALGTLNVLFDVAYQSYVPTLVARPYLAHAYGRLATTAAGAKVIGPSAGGWLVSVLGPPLAIVIDAISYLASAVAILRIKTVEPVHTPAIRSGSAVGRIADALAGIRHVVEHRFLRGIAASNAIANFFDEVFAAVYLLYAVRVLGVGPEVVGLAFGIGSVGGLLAAAFAHRIAAVAGPGRTIVAASICRGLGYVLVPIAPVAFAIPFLVAAQVVTSIGMPLFMVNASALAQASTPDSLRSRMTATMGLLYLGMLPLGALLGGALGTFLGLSPTLWIGAVGIIVAALPVALSPLSGVRTLAFASPSRGSL